MGEVKDNNGQDWYVKAELTVIGPKEKPVIITGEYLGTNRGVAENLQNQFGAAITALNQAK